MTFLTRLFSPSIDKLREAADACSLVDIIVADPISIRARQAAEAIVALAHDDPQGLVNVLLHTTHPPGAALIGMLDALRTIRLEDDKGGALQAKYARLQDRDLLRIVDDERNYTALAVAIARSELARRGRPAKPKFVFRSRPQPVHVVIDALSLFPSPGAIATLRAVMREPDLVVRFAAAKALVRCGDAHAAEDLLSAATDADWRIRWEAMTRLAELGDGRLVEPLVAAMKQEIRVTKSYDGSCLDAFWFTPKYVEVERRAFALVKQVGGAATELISLLRGRDALEICQCLHLLCAIPDSRATTAVAALVEPGGTAHVYGAQFEHEWVRDDALKVLLVLRMNDLRKALSQAGAAATDPAVIAMDGLMRRAWATPGHVLHSEALTLVETLIADLESDVNRRPDHDAVLHDLKTERGRLKEIDDGAGAQV